MTSFLEPGPAAESPPKPRRSGLACEVITDFNQLNELSSDWDRLWKFDPESEFFQSFRWAQAWWNSFADGMELRAAVVREDGEVVLILPLVEKRGKLRFLGSPQADYCDVLCNRANAPQLLEFAFRSVLESLPGWTECILDHLRPGSHIVRAWQELPLDLRRLMRLEVGDTCPAILLGEKREAVIASLLAGKHLRRRLNKLQKAGNVTFRHVENAGEAQEQLSLFFRSHRRRCALLAKTSCFERAEMRELMRSLARELDLRRDLRLGVLELNGQPLAWSIGFQTHGKYAYYQQTFDVDAEEFAPGEVLLHFLLSYAKDSVEREFDFLRGDEFFKKRFATQVSQNRCLYLQRPGIGGQLRRMRRTLQGRGVALETRIQDFARKRENVFQIFRWLWIWRRTHARRLRWANEQGELRHYVLGSFREWARGAIWRKEVSTLFQNGGTVTATLPECMVSDPAISLVRGQLSDLADLALDYPEIRFPTFREYRKRLKNGDCVYLIYQNRRLLLVAWTACRAAAQPYPIASASTVPGARPTLAMYECWPIHNPHAGCTRLLTMLAADGAGKADLLVCCPAVPPEQRVALENRGFLPKSQIVQLSMFGWLRRKSTLPPAAGDERKTKDRSCPKMGEGSNP